MINLTAGTRFPIESDQGLFHLHLEGDMSSQVQFAALCFPAGKVGQVPPDSCIYRSDQSLYSSAVRFEKHGSTQKVNIDFAHVPAHIERIYFVCWVVESQRRLATNFSSLQGTTFDIQDKNGKKLATCSNFHQRMKLESAALVGEVYRKNGWRFKMVAAGFQAGLVAMGQRLLIPTDLLEQMDLSLSGAGPAGQSSRPSQNQRPRQRGDLSDYRLPLHWPGNIQPKVPKNVLPALVRIIVQESDGEGGVGTGFCISPGGTIVTANHVIHNCTTILVKFEKQSDLREAKVIYTDPPNDLAIIQVQDRWGSPHWLPFAKPSDEIDIGEDIALLGYPLGVLGQEINYSKGIINSIRNIGGTSVLQVDAGAAPGSSGGPLFRQDDGLVLGVLSSVLISNSIAMNVNFAIDIRQLECFTS